MKKLNILSLIGCSLFISGAFAKGPVKDTTSNKILVSQFRFESPSDLQGWRTTKGKLELSPRHFKDGSKAVCWSWQQGSVLTIDHLKGLTEAAGIYPGGIPEFYEPAFYPRGRYGGIKMWLYQEKAQKGQVVFQVGSSVESARKNPKYVFRVNLGFTGWRAVWVNLEEDAKVTPYAGNDDMTSIIAYPSDEVKGNGELFMDHLTLLTFISNKRHSDLQFENSKHAFRQADSYEILKPYQKYMNADLTGEAFNLGELGHHTGIIADRLEFLILGDQSGDWEQRSSGIEKVMSGAIQAGLSFYDRLNLQYRDGFLTGVPLFASRDEHPADEGLVFQATSQVVTFPLAMDYRINGKTESKGKLIRVLDHFEDQGWAAGSALGTVDHVIRLNAIANAIFLIRDELRQQNKLTPRIEMLLWHTRMGNLLDIDYTKGENTDKVRGGALVKLITILLMEDGAEKAAMMRSFKEYMDYVIDFAPGYSDTMKPDYSIYHHRGTYLNSYGVQSVNTVALIHWLLQGTPYALSGKSTDILKKTLIHQSRIAFGTDLHYGVSGRFPHQNSAIGRFLLPAFAFMSLNGNAVADTVLAKRFNYFYGFTDASEITEILTPALTYSGTFGTLDLIVRVHQQMQGKTSKPGEGHYTMPYSGLSVHRTGNAYAAVKGYNKYIWDFETGSSAGENNLGRYLSFGYLITVQGNEKNGFEGAGMDMNNGYHWAFLPGATTKALPIEQVHFVNKATGKYIEGYHRSFSKTTFANGLSQEGKNGIYAMELRDDVGPDKDMILFDSTFRAKKSYFFIGDEIICLGSDIGNTDKRYATVTTLFQYRFDKERPTYYNTRPLGSSLSIYEKVQDGYFTDQNGIHYLIHGGSDIVIEQHEQQSLRRRNRVYEPVVSPHTKAYLDHGHSPVGAAYEYQIVLNTPASALQPLLQEKSYEVLRKDADIHSIYHKGTGITGYAFFTPQTNLKAGPVRAVDTPVLAMFKEPGSYAVLTVANPDLQLTPWNHNMSRMPDEIVNSASKGGLVRITLDGEWHAAAAVHDVLSVEQANGSTTITLYCKDGKSVDIPLKKRSK